MDIIIKPSSRKDKKYDAIIDGKKTIPFGDKNYQDYTMHKDKERKQRYLERHKNDNYKNPLYPSFYSTNLLWSKPTLNESIKDINRKFKNVNIKFSAFK
jgi:hypothetical protein